MFTGLVEKLGILHDFTETPDGRRFRIDAPGLEVALGDSVAVNGCCLTVAEILQDALRFDLLGETLARTNLGDLAPGSLVNLERALAANARLGGHFVQGHVDCCAIVLDTRERGPDLKLTFELPPKFARYVIEKGSIAVNGVSLTIASLESGHFDVWIIPHTRAETNLGALRAGERVNLEFDLLAKYVEKMLRSER